MNDHQHRPLGRKTQWLQDSPDTCPLVDPQPSARLIRMVNGGRIFLPRYICKTEGQGHRPKFIWEPWPCQPIKDPASSNSKVTHFIFKSRLKRTSYNSFQPNNQQFIYTDEVTDLRIEYCVNLFNMSLYIIKPQLVIDYRSK